MQGLLEGTLGKTQNCLQGQDGIGANTVLPRLQVLGMESEDTKPIMTRHWIGRAAYDGIKARTDALRRPRCGPADDGGDAAELQLRVMPERVVRALPHRPLTDADLQQRAACLRDKSPRNRQRPPHVWTPRLPCTRRSDRAVRCCALADV